jgi:hypothetical protein
VARPRSASVGATFTITRPDSFTYDKRTDLQDIFQTYRNGSNIEVKNAHVKALALLEGSMRYGTWNIIWNRYSELMKRQHSLAEYDQKLVYNLRSLICDAVRRQTAQLLSNPDTVLDAGLAADEMFFATNDEDKRRRKRLHKVG